MHRIIVAKWELFRYGIQSDDDCLYYGEKDSIYHTFSDCAFVKQFSHEVISWFNVTNSSQSVHGKQTVRCYIRPIWKKYKEET